MTEAALPRIQIHEAIKAHFDKEQVLFQQGVKVLTLYFIDEVVKYRDYSAPDEKGEHLWLYNQHLAQKALHHEAPVQALKRWRSTHPDLFLREVRNHPGPGN